MLNTILIKTGHSHYYKQSSTIVSMATTGATKESKEKVTTSNVLYNSIKLASTIEKPLETMNQHIASIITTFSTINPTTKSVVRLIKSEIKNVSNYNTILKQEIAP